ncbi:hypothetical protein AAP_02970 [Ascosphaera apis ARSEF 7405]|uniref:Uncharacterized protein n=1 Tax=Ascosphaera apis ARSEF 7405 TaxID=392613 RepID=A0A167Z8I6_9EURO|nr:hypothetical protein AAP_02970 [Ascosphaera apis ARSEF 7405]
MEALNDPFGPKSPPKRTKTGPLHQLNALKASGHLSLSLLAINAIIVGQYVARYSGLTFDICLSDHPEEEKLCESYVLELVGVTIMGLLLAIFAAAIVQNYSSARMDRVLQSVGAGIVGGLAWGMRTERATCVRALEMIQLGNEQGNGGSCLRGMRYGVLGSLAMLVVLLLVDQSWFKEEKPREEQLPGAKLD